VADVNENKVVARHGGVCAEEAALTLRWFRYSFICQGTSTRRQRSDLFGLRINLPPVTTSLGNPIKFLAQGHNKRTCQPISTLTISNFQNFNPILCRQK